MSEKFVDKDKLACQSDDCDEGVSAVAPSTNPPARGANFTEMVETLEENEDMVECKECYDLVPKEACIKGEHGWICPTCGSMKKDSAEDIEIENGFDYYDSEFPEVETYDDRFADTMKETQERFEFDTDFIDFADEEEPSTDLEDTPRATLNELAYSSDDVVTLDDKSYDPKVLHTWTCIFDNKEIGEVQAYTEDEAYMEMERQFPEYHYGEHDGVALVALNESATTLNEAPGDGAIYNVSRGISNLADKAAAWSQLKLKGDNSIIDYFFGDTSIFREIDATQAGNKNLGFIVVAIPAGGFTKSKNDTEAVDAANNAIRKANRNGKGNSFGKIDEAIAVAKAVSTRHTEVTVTISIENFSEALQRKIKAEYPKLLTVIKGKTSSFTRAAQSSPILEFKQGKSTPKTIDPSLRNSLRDIKADIEANFQLEDFELKPGKGSDSGEEPVPGGESGKGWKCPNCGEMNEADDTSCGECGEDRPKESEKSKEGGWECPSCGKTNYKKFCTSCKTPKPAEADEPGAKDDHAKVRQRRNELEDLIDEAKERLEDENPEEEGLRDKFYDRVLNALEKLASRVYEAESLQELESLAVEAKIEGYFEKLAAVEGRGNSKTATPSEEPTPQDEPTSEEEPKQEDDNSLAEYKEKVSSQILDAMPDQNEYTADSYADFENDIDTLINLVGEAASIDDIKALDPEAELKAAIDKLVKKDVANTTQGEEEPTSTTGSGKLAKTGEGADLPTGKELDRNDAVRKAQDTAQKLIRGIIKSSGAETEGDLKVLVDKLTKFLTKQYKSEFVFEAYKRKLIGECTKFIAEDQVTALNEAFGDLNFADEAKADDLFARADDYEEEQEVLKSSAAEEWDDDWADDWDSEDAEEIKSDEETVICGFCSEEVLKCDCRHEVDLGYLCGRCENAIKSRGEELTFTE